MVLEFDYQMKISYAKPVEKCHFTIKCIPMNTERQRLLDKQIQMSPLSDFSYGQDSFGNKKIYGCVKEEHDTFLFQIQGHVDVNDLEYEEIADMSQIGMYKYPCGLCVPDKEMEEYLHSIDFSGCGNDLTKSIKIMNKLYADYMYVPLTTNVHTKASEAFSLGMGVCQDYAHIFICLSRLAGIPCRYVCGLIIGQGKSHAWVEVLHKGKWVGLDPTNNCFINKKYIKVGHGLDASSCSINRGIVLGGGLQNQEIQARVVQQ